MGVPTVRGVVYLCATEAFAMMDALGTRISPTEERRTA